MKDLVIYGFGGFGKEVATIIKRINNTKPTWNFIGYIDDGVSAGKENRYGKVLGDINFLNNYTSDLSVVIAVANPKYLEKISTSIVNPKISFPNIIAPTVNIFDIDAFQIGKGNIISWDARISCDVKIGNFNLINGLASLGHDVSIGNYNVVGPSVRFSGCCTIGDSCLFGAGALFLQGLKIGGGSRVGLGSVVIRNVKENTSYFGNPAKIVEG